jgi:hypothetical protein
MSKIIPNFFKAIVWLDWIWQRSLLMVFELFIAKELNPGGKLLIGGQDHRSAFIQLRAICNCFVTKK